MRFIREFLKRSFGYSLYFNLSKSCFVLIHESQMPVNPITYKLVCRAAGLRSFLKSSNFTLHVTDWDAYSRDSSEYLMYLSGRNIPPHILYESLKHCRELRLYHVPLKYLVDIYLKNLSLKTRVSYCYLTATAKPVKGISADTLLKGSSFVQYIRWRRA